MTRTLTTVRNVIFGAAIAAGLGFGATQALAAPQAPEGAPVCSSICAPECGSFGGTYKAGRCLCCG